MFRLFAPTRRHVGKCVLLGTYLTGVAIAQSQELPPGPSKPTYVVILPKQAQGAVRDNVSNAASVALPTWSGSFSYNGTNYPYNMVGAAPSANTSTTVPTYIIPIKVVIKPFFGTATTYDPATVLPNGKTVVQNTVLSPIFDSTTTYILNGINVGRTQYIDAVQRANFWNVGGSNSNNHLLLGGPTVLPEQTLTPPVYYSSTATEFGFKAGLVDINWFDSQVQGLITKLGIQPNTFPIFLTYDVYLTQNRSCCIGGYHSANGGQSYTHATYVDKVGAFAQDVSALSHEVGEWAADPLTVNPNGNQTPCGILETGDPLENNPNYGDFPYAVNGFSYNLQDLAMMPYFDFPVANTVNGWFTFHGQSLTACKNGS